MHWAELEKRIEIAKKSWQLIKKDPGREPRSIEFLSKSFLVLANRSGQIKLKELEHDGLRKIATEHASFFKRTEQNLRFLRLCRNLQNLEKYSQRLRPRNTQLSQVRMKMDNLKRQIDAYDATQLAFSDELSVEIRFPKVRIQLIQRLKHHALVDSTRTSMSLASIRVILRSAPTDR